MAFITTSLSVGGQLHAQLHVESAALHPPMHAPARMRCVLIRVFGPDNKRPRLLVGKKPVGKS
jgi:hypothetical protein